MEFREFAWAQQLYRQRLIYGPAAEATENSYPKYPAAALRELIRQSQHPHNLEPLLLTLARPANADTRKRFAEVAGELVLVERVLSDDVICEDLQVVMGNRVEKAPDGMLYPDKSSQVGWVAVDGGVTAVTAITHVAACVCACASAARVRPLQATGARARTACPLPGASRRQPACRGTPACMNRPAPQPRARAAGAV